MLQMRACKEGFQSFRRDAVSTASAFGLFGEGQAGGALSFLGVCHSTNGGVSRHTLRRYGMLSHACPAELVAPSRAHGRRLNCPLGNSPFAPSRPEARSPASRGHSAHAIASRRLTMGDLELFGAPRDGVWHILQFARDRAPKTEGVPI